MCLTTTSINEDSIPASLTIGALCTSTCGAGAGAGASSTGGIEGALTEASPPFIRTM